MLVTRTPKAGLVVASDGPVVVGLETALTPELVAEGLAREFVSHVQNLRKEADFVVDQKIRIVYSGDDAVAKAVGAFLDWICGETLAVFCEQGQVSGDPADLNGHPCAISVVSA